MKNSIKLIPFLFLSILKINAQTSCNDEIIREGEGTFYDIDQFGGFGNCSLDHSQIDPFLIGAMNEQDYGTADFCGACVEITGPNGVVKVKIIDRCPECAPGDIDLSPEAFIQLAPLIDGRIPISWKVVPCEITGPMRFFYKEGSNQWFTSVQVRNHLNPIEKLEFFDGDSFVDVPRKQYNFFTREEGMGLGPHTFRVTDIYGNSIIEGGINFILTTEIEGTNQFPECNITGIEEEIISSKIKVVNGNLIFDDLKGEYQLLDVSGKEVRFGIIENEVSVEFLNSGFYILKFNNEANGVFTKRIFLEN